MENIIVIGGGIGGLTTAIALQKKAFKVAVYEAAPEMKALGAGLVLAANAVKALQEIGIAEAVLRQGQALRNLRIPDSVGKIISEIDATAIAERFGGVHNFAIHRADLQQALLAELQPNTLHLGKRLNDVVQDDNGVTATFDDGTTAQGAILIATDGIHSVVRKKFVPESEPRYAGYTCWRGVIDATPVQIDTDQTSETWGIKGRFGIVPLTRNRLYWFAVVNAKSHDQRLKAFTIRDLQEHFKDYHTPIPQILAATTNEQMIWNDIIDLKPLKKFVFGRIALAGDAAHATTPNLGQGACMAIEDAAVMANSLDKVFDLKNGLLRFEEKRVPRTTQIVNASWRVGRIAQWENQPAAWLRNSLFRLMPDSTNEKQFKMLYEVDFY